MIDEQPSDEPVEGSAYLPLFQHLLSYPVCMLRVARMSSAGLAALAELLRSSLQLAPHPPLLQRLTVLHIHEHALTDVSPDVFQSFAHWLTHPASLRRHCSLSVYEPRPIDREDRMWVFAASREAVQWATQHFLKTERGSPGVRALARAVVAVAAFAGLSGHWSGGGSGGESDVAAASRRISLVLINTCKMTEEQAQAWLVRWIKLTGSLIEGLFPLAAMESAEAQSWAPALLSLGIFGTSADLSAVLASAHLPFGCLGRVELADGPDSVASLALIAQRQPLLHTCRLRPAGDFIPQLTSMLELLATPMPHDASAASSSSSSSVSLSAALPFPVLRVVEVHGFFPLNLPAPVPWCAQLGSPLVRYPATPLRLRFVDESVPVMDASAAGRRAATLWLRALAEVRVLPPPHWVSYVQQFADEEFCRPAGLIKADALFSSRWKDAMGAGALVNSVMLLPAPPLPSFAHTVARIASKRALSTRRIVEAPAIALQVMPTERAGNLDGLSLSSSGPPDLLRLCVRAFPNGLSCLALLPPACLSSLVVVGPSALSPLSFVPYSRQDADEIAAVKQMRQCLQNARESLKEVRLWGTSPSLVREMLEPESEKPVSPSSVRPMSPPSASAAPVRTDAISIEIKSDARMALPLSPSNATSVSAASLSQPGPLSSFHMLPLVQPIVTSFLTCCMWSCW